MNCTKCHNPVGKGLRLWINLAPGDGPVSPGCRECAGAVADLLSVPHVIAVHDETWEVAMLFQDETSTLEILVAESRKQPLRFTLLTFADPVTETEQ